MNVGPAICFYVFAIFYPWRDSIKSSLCLLQLILEDLKRNDKVDYETIQDHLDNFQEWTTKDMHKEVGNVTVRVSSIYLAICQRKRSF